MLMNNFEIREKLIKLNKEELAVLHFFRIFPYCIFQIFPSIVFTVSNF